jgi:uncharacterized protein YabN with tetrapyrrole methylase and pyrophosphatase domain
MEEKLLKIINHYGVNNQLRQFNEEAFELQEIILDYEFSSENLPKQHEICKEQFLNHITEEIADCYVMLDQFQFYYGIKDEEIWEMMNFKIDRQLKRMEEK